MVEIENTIKAPKTFPEIWQPIASAPRDGTFVLTKVGPWQPCITHFATYDGHTRWGSKPEGFMTEEEFLRYWHEVSYDPTEWMPLPDEDVADAIETAYRNGFEDGERHAAEAVASAKCDAATYKAQLDALIARLKAPIPSAQSTMTVTLDRKLGMTGSAFDPPGPHRAYTYQHQPHNVPAYRLGRAYASVTDSGDHIDWGLSLLRTLEAEGFGVFEIEPNSDPAPQEREDGPSYLDFITSDDVFDKGPDAVKAWQEAERAGIVNPPPPQRHSKRDRQRLQSAFKKGVKEGRRIEREARGEGQGK